MSTASATPDSPAALKLDHLRALEAESIHILREVVAEFERPVMLYSIGKDSSVLLRLAQKAFYPGTGRRRKTGHSGLPRASVSESRGVIEHTP